MLTLGCALSRFPSFNAIFFAGGPDNILASSSTLRLLGLATSEGMLKDMDKVSPVARTLLGGNETTPRAVSESQGGRETARGIPQAVSELQGGRETARGIPQAVSDPVNWSNPRLGAELARVIFFFGGGRDPLGWCNARRFLLIVEDNASALYSIKFVSRDIRV